QRPLGVVRKLVAAFGGDGVPHEVELQRHVSVGPPRAAVRDAPGAHPHAASPSSAGAARRRAPPVAGPPAARLRAPRARSGGWPGSARGGGGTPLRARG